MLNKFLSALVLLIFCNNVFATQAMEDIKIINLSKKIMNHEVDNYEKTFGTIVIINKLSGFKSEINLESERPVIAQDGNLKITLHTCVKDFDANIKNYLASIEVESIDKNGKPEERLMFNGVISSEFTYKNQIQNRLYAINLLHCDEGKA